MMDEHNIIFWRILEDDLVVKIPVHIKNNFQ